MSCKRLVPVVLAGLLGTACTSDDAQGGPPNLQTSQYPLPRLSDYRFFTDLATQEPNEGVIPYTVAAPLWADAAGKGRFFVVPDGASIEYTEQDEWVFPAGTVFIKSFFFFMIGLMFPTELRLILLGAAFAVMLLIGLLTRFAAISLIVVTMVATAAVHWPAEWSGFAELWSGYVITSNGNGNFKLPLLFVVMLLPLVFNGAGKVSLDHLLISLAGRGNRPDSRSGLAQSAGLALLILGVSFIWLEPAWGFCLLTASGLSMLFTAVRGKS